MRKPLMAGNWKMYKTAGETSAFFKKFAPMVAGATHAEVVICTPFVNLPLAVEAARPTAIEVGAQDVFWLKEGAYTGEVSAPMLAAVGCRWVIVGHSERRQYFGETDETVLKKTIAAKNKELAQLRADVPALVRAVNQLTLENLQLPDMRAAGGTVVTFPGRAPARPRD